MTDSEISLLKKQMKRLWIAIGLMFLMIVILVSLLVNNYLYLYNWMLGRPIIISYMGNITMMFVLVAILFFFAVIIAAIAKHEDHLVESDSN